MTAPAVRAALAGNPVILLPMGSFEDQGPHAPMGDYLSADAIALRIAGRATGQGVPCFVAPVLPFGGADWFGSVPGAIALGPGTIRAVVADMLGAFLRHGLTRLLVLNGHGGNEAPIREATLQISRERRVVVPSFYLWKVAATLLDPDSRKTAGHGADPLASVAWHLFPELCDPARAGAPGPPGTVLGLPVSGFGTVRFDGVDIDVPMEFDAVGPTGDARGASAERGAALVERLVEIGAALARHLQEVQGQNP
jgi:creatinine amidohydrolase